MLTCILPVRVRFFVFSLVGLSILASSGPLWAQHNNQNKRQHAQQNRKQPEPLRASGEIVGVARGFIKIMGSANEAWVLQVPSPNAIIFRGTTDTGFLKSGMFVEFIANVDIRRGRLTEKVGSLLVFSPSQEHMTGAFPEGDGGVGMGGGLEGDKPVDKKKKRGKKTPVVEPKRMMIGGQITSIAKGGKLIMRVPNLSPKLKVELTDEPVVTIEVFGYALAKRGDKLTVTRGTMIQQGFGKIATAEIEAANPLTTGRKKKTRTSKSQRSSRSRTPKNSGKKKEIGGFGFDTDNQTKDTPKSKMPKDNRGGFNFDQ